MAYDRYVQSRRGSRHAIPPLPKDAWVGRIFVEADGTICEVVASGKMPTPERPWFITGGSTLVVNRGRQLGVRKIQ